MPQGVQPSERLEARLNVQRSAHSPAQPLKPSSRPAPRWLTRPALPLWDVAVVLLALLYVVVFAWPASINPWRWVWGSHGDALGNAFEFTWIDEAIRSHQPVTVDPKIAIPFGENLSSLPHEPLFYFAQVHLGSLIGPVASLNLISLMAIPIAAWVMYRLALRVTGSEPAAFFGGIAFGCSSFTFINSRGEATLVQVWIFPLVAIALLHVLARPGIWSILVAGVTIAGASMVNFYYSLFIALVSLTLAVGWLFAKLLFQRRLPMASLVAVSAAGLLALGLSGSIFVSTFGNLQQRAEQLQRTPEDLAVLAPEPIDFLLPPRANPWFSKFRQEHFELRLQRTGAYVDLGEMAVPVPVLLLAPLGVALLLAQRHSGQGESLPRRRVELVALLAVVLLGLWLTIPPTVFRHRLMFLSLQWDIYSLVPAYRAFHRAVILVEMGACALASAALALFFRRGSKLLVPVVLGLSSLVLLEAYQVAHDNVLEVASPPEYSWLAAHPGDYAVAEYPLLPANSGGNEYTYEFNQRFHHHPILNGHLTGTESESMREELRDPNRTGVAERLATLGIRFVLWHTDVVEQFRPVNPDSARQLSTYQPRPPSYQLEASFADGAQVYSVNLPESGTFAFYAAGFAQLEPRTGEQWGRWMSPSKGRLDLFNSSAPREAELRFQCESDSVARTLEVFQSGRSLGSWQIPAGRNAVISLRAQAPPGISRLEMEVSPGPASGRPSIFCTTVSIKG